MTRPMPALEIISRLPKGAAHPIPLVFVHGAFSGGWIWDVKVMPRFAGLGFACHALSLRGHGGSEGRDMLNLYGIEDYVADLRETVKRVGQPPILIGHSMGGFIVQEYMRAGGVAAGVVLMASVPPYGIWDCLVGMSARNPDAVLHLGLLQAWGKSAVNLDTIGRALFAESMPPAEMRRYEPYFQRESMRITWELLTLSPMRRPWRPGATPVLVQGAGQDRFVPPTQVAITAQLLGCEPVIFPKMAHAMMLDPGWEPSVDLIAYWVDQKVSR